MNKLLLFVGSLLTGSVLGQTIVNDTLYFTGNEQNWTVPCGVSSVVIELNGAAGSQGNSISTENVGGAAGKGGRVVGELNDLTEGELFYVYVGGIANFFVGGYNGGGNGQLGSGVYGSGGGGGATDIRRNGNELSNRILVAGGGGGGGNAGIHSSGSSISGGNGGNGGGSSSENFPLDGGNGETTIEILYGNDSPGATGGTVNSPGITGAGCSMFLGQNGSSGSLGQGGNGGLGNEGFGLAQSHMAPHGGGGGGGFVGGNGGGGGSAGNAGCSGNAFGAGGGGSAGTNSNLGFEISSLYGVNDSWGYAVFTYTTPAPPVVQIDENFTVPCVGDDVIISGNPSNGQWSTIQGNSADMIDGVFSPSQEGTYKLVYSYIYCETAYNDTIEITVNCTLGLNDLYASSIQIYPNPTSEHFSIENALGSNITINDLTGKTTLTVEEYNGESIDVSTLSNGVYIVSILKNGQMSSTRLVKD